MYLVGSIRDKTTKDSDMSLLKISQLNGVMTVTSSYTITNTSRLNENATCIVLDSNDPPNVYIGGYSNVDTPDILDSSLPILYKLSQDIANNTFTIDTTFIYREFANKNDTAAYVVNKVLEGDSNILAAITDKVISGKSKALIIKINNLMILLKILGVL